MCAYFGFLLCLNLPYTIFPKKWTYCHESTVKCIESTMSLLTIHVVYSIKEKTDRHKTACSPLNAYSIYVFLISEHFPCGIGISASFTILMERLEIFWIYSIFTRKDRWGRKNCCTASAVLPDHPDSLRFPELLRFPDEIKVFVPAPRSIPAAADRSS